MTPNCSPSSFIDSGKGSAAAVCVTVTVGAGDGEGEVSPGLVGVALALGSDVVSGTSKTCPDEGHAINDEGDPVVIKNELKASHINAPAPLAGCRTASAT